MSNIQVKSPWKAPTAPVLPLDEDLKNWLALDELQEESNITSDILYHKKNKEITTDLTWKMVLLIPDYIDESQSETIAEICTVLNYRFCCWKNCIYEVEGAGLEKQPVLKHISGLTEKDINEIL